MNRSYFARLSLCVSVATAIVQTAGAAPHKPAERADSVPSIGQSSGRPRAGQFGGGFGGSNENVELRDRFDKDGNKRLDADERRAARTEAETLGLNRGRGGRRGGGANAAPPQAGVRISQESVRPYPTTPFYDTNTLRSVFLEFENDEWEQELMAFKRTDIDVPATMTIDGKKYEDVGIQFHGNSSFSSVPLGLKHSMRLDLEFVHENQDVRSYNTLLLLNGHDDPSLLHTLLYMEIARHYGPAPAANFVRVVISGENWGIFVNQQ